VFVNQLEHLGRNPGAARAVMAEVWGHFEAAISQQTARGWLDTRSFFLQLTRK
jgi:hypothetical protein